MLFGKVAAGKVHPQPHISAFGNEKNMILLGRAHQLSLACCRFEEAAFVVISNEQWSHAPLSQCSREQFFFFLKNQCS
jgi:hypothetical protein